MNGIQRDGCPRDEAAYCAAAHNGCVRVGDYDFRQGNVTAVEYLEGVMDDLTHRFEPRFGCKFGDGDLRSLGTLGFNQVTLVAHTLGVNINTHSGDGIIHLARIDICLCNDMGCKYIGRLPCIESRYRAARCDDGVGIAYRDVVQVVAAVVVNDDFVSQNIPDGAVNAVDGHLGDQQVRVRYGDLVMIGYRIVTGAWVIG